MANNVLECSERNGISVLISGAGVGGLMAGLECWRKGFDVQILERTKENITTGDSFSLGPSAFHTFTYWPEMDEHRKAIAYQPSVSFCNQKGEHLVGPMRMEEFLNHLPEDLRDMCRYSRPKFHQVLLAQLKKIGVEVQYGSEVVEYFEDEARGKAGVVIEDGSRLEADLIIAADGVRSPSSMLVAGKPVPARSSGRGIFRVAFPAVLATADPVVAERFQLQDDESSCMEMWIGPKMAAFFWLNHDEMHFGMSHQDDGTAEEAWSQRSGPEKVLEWTSTIPGWPEAADRVIKAAPVDRFIDWKLMWRDPQPIWTSPAGHLVQLGDAAHTFLPSSGNGGTQALEDAVSLAACLRMAGSREKIPDAVRVHNLLRFERVSCLQAFGVMNREKQETGNENINKAAKSDFIHIGRWIVDHNPEEYAVENYHQALAHLQTGSGFINTNTPSGLVYKPWTIEGLVEAQKKGEPSILDVIACAS